MSKPIIHSKITVFKTLIRARNWQQHSISNIFKIIKYHDDMDIACCKELQGNVLFHQFVAQHILGLANLVMRVYLLQIVYKTTFLYSLIVVFVYKG